ncbi:hypothetical protein ASD42_01885 [Nocardia sp. Root136]|uniref:hypothetical protein n=1 Tax=Nocardia sp. Root136 TaxID=1736458 RepID=UPI0006F3410D|nr:hypothetical protein [Nocardia sp. Root136]KQY37377.1 hypothetical protein ASD42_01885 [Nocardia sp. Root136]
MDRLDIVAQWRRDIAIADNDGDAAVRHLHGDVAAVIGVEGQHGLTTEKDESGRRTGTHGED